MLPYGQHSPITVVSFEDQAKMKVVAIGLTTWRTKVLGQNWGLIGLSESLGLLSVKKTKNGLREKERYIETGTNPQTQHQPYLHSCFCMNTWHPEHPFSSWRDVLNVHKGCWTTVELMCRVGICQSLEEMALAVLVRFVGERHAFTFSASFIWFMSVICLHFLWYEKKNGLVIWGMLPSHYPLCSKCKPK